MSAGRYRSAVELQAPVFTASADGSQSLVYTPAGSDFAEIRLLRQGEAVSAGSLRATATHSIRLRRRDDIGAGWQVTSPRDRFRLLSVAEEGRRGEYSLCLAEVETETEEAPS
ncbi:head-tail adaptor protein [Roseibium sp. CAU 1637]|uniref:Head-tail adaptor protein n=1 Tax=Roseibium limicola TaxID=2816037 RepID=A0A939J4X1_9HYPH|nr:head-tail adaptor protein [Roseibium limicola]MBO0345200.1 head-tail adaptor protein [Roseibium limicola]